MKKVWNSMFQAVSESVKTLRKQAAKKARHDVVLMTTGISVVTMLTFAAGDLNGAGGSKMVAFAETQVHMTEAQTETGLDTADVEQLMIGEEHIEVEKANLEFGVSHAEEKEITLWNMREEATEVNENTKETEAETAAAQKRAAEPVIEESADDVAEAVKVETEAANAEIAETAEVVKETEKTEQKKEGRGEVALSGDEYQVLLRIVQAEAGICDEKGKLLVANVILNRMESDEFPNTVKGVVYQKHQFSPVMNGTINTCKISMETRSAVNRALNGEDPSEGALYFMNRGKSASRNVRWFDNNLDFLFKHGSHEFFR